MKLKPAQFIHLFFCTAPILFSIAAILVNKNTLFFDYNLSTSAPFNPLFPLLGIVGMATSQIAFHKMIAKSRETSTFDQKFTIYQTAFLVKLAILEGATLINIVAFFITNNTFFLLFAAAGLLLLIISRPTKTQVIQTLDLQFPDTENL